MTEESYPSVQQIYCPCGGIILADTEEWKVPRCYQCWHEMGEPEKEGEK